ncbi:uncharacterized protein LOC110466277 [Mizuhopecten yessoensis]|uniref:uncharacterized protein LOC110466277 n=1 Tax=Mizuhopecten yessoensis TaxID=6573 RepID=UPI000B458513|nr:uncharacterized protein LOC110466277 [Mizuhopecten yessoensis]
MLVAVYFLCVIGSSWAQDGINNLQVRTPDVPTSPIQPQRSAQQFRIPNSLPNNFRSSDRPSIQTSQFTNNLGGFRTGFSPSRIGANGWMNSNGLLMMFPTQSGRMTPGFAFNRPAPIDSVIRRSTLPFIPQNRLQFSRGHNPVGFNFGRRFTGSSLNHPSLLGTNRPNPIISRRNNVVPQVNPSTTHARRPVVSNSATQRLVDFILGRRAQNTNQRPIQQSSQTNSIVETSNPSQSQPDVPKQTGHTSNSESSANINVNQASSNFRFRSRSDEEIRREAQEKLRQINEFLARSPSTVGPRFANTGNNQVLPPAARRHFSNANRRLERLDQNSLSKRILEAFKNRDKSGKTPVVVDGGFSQDVLPPVYVDGGVSWRNQGILINPKQQVSSFNLETNKDLAKLFPVPS